MFKIKNREFFPIINKDGTQRDHPFVVSFIKLTRQTLTVNTLEDFMKLQKRVSEIESEAFAKRNELFNKFAKNGTIPEKNLKSFTKEFNDLLEIETEVEFDDIELVSEPGIQMSPEEIIPIARLFTFSK